MTSHSSVIAKLEERHEKQSIEIVDKFPLLNTVSDNVILGSFSWYWMQAKQKHIMRPYAMQFGNVTTTPSELARTYLELKYPRQRATSEQIKYFKVHTSAPLYALPHTYEEGVYIDIRSAYWQILQIVGWDADYNPARWLGKGVPMDDFAYADIKLSRNCLVTAGLPSDATFWKGEKQVFERLSTHNRVANLGIWTLVNDILHGVAWDAIRSGAIYVHTDGYICAASRTDAVISAIREWGLEARIKKHGYTKVFGVGSYTFGNTETHTPKQDHAHDGLILSSHREWLKRKVRFFSERTNFIWKSNFLTEKQ
jgi:hypothetical protein